MLISGIVGSKSTHLPAIAGKVPNGTKKESRIKKFSRWIKNERIEAEIYFLPYADALLAGLAADHTLALVMDGSEVGRKCLALMVNVVYKKRALPIGWIVVKGNKGHFPEEAHVQLLEQVRQIVPEGADVIFLGDGEFDGITLQATIEGYGWEYVCRTAENTQLGAEGDRFSFRELRVQPGECIDLPEVTFTLQDYGPVLAIAWWKTGYEEPIYLVTNMELVNILTSYLYTPTVTPRASTRKRVSSSRMRRKPSRKSTRGVQPSFSRASRMSATRRETPPLSRRLYSV